MNYKTVYELLEDESRWTQKAVAKDEEGRMVASFDEGAVSWCLWGATKKVYGEKYSEILDRVWPKSEKEGPVTFNDSHTHTEVLALVKELGI